MKIKTARFGEIEVDETLVFRFPVGLPGFAGEQHFVLLKAGLEETPLLWMQSTSQAELCFLLVDPLQAFAAYEVTPDEETLTTLEAQEGQTLSAFALVSVPNGELAQATVNLKAPIILNPERGLGMQCIFNNDAYSVRHPLFSETGVK